MMRGAMRHFYSTEHFLHRHAKELFADKSEVNVIPTGQRRRYSELFVSAFVDPVYYNLNIGEKVDPKISCADGLAKLITV